MDTTHGEHAPSLAPASPEDRGIDVAALRAAVARAEAGEPALPRAMDGWLSTTLAREPWPRVMGPIADRGAPSGVVVVGGRTVARWGAPERRDMAFSIAKSVLATVAGTAFDDGLLPDLDEPAVLRAPIDALGGDVPTGALDPVAWTGAGGPVRVAEGSLPVSAPGDPAAAWFAAGSPRVGAPDDGDAEGRARRRAAGGETAGGPDPSPRADPEVARTITWRQLLTQTSDWRGTLYGVPWWADPQGRQAPDAPAEAPGARFAYNDVRTNLCSLALTHLIGASNAETLGSRILRPIGVPDGWSWRGLHPMRTTVTGRDGAPREVAVTTGGSHWGGGLWCTAEDLARYGLLHLRGGTWGAERLLSAAWCAELLRPTPVREPYGLMWWRNPEAGGPVGPGRAGRSVASSPADPAAGPHGPATPGPAPSPLGAVAGEDAFYPGSGVRGFAAHGTGDQVVWCDPDRDLVAVVRWATAVEPILAAITAAVPVVPGSAP
jgi:hypothetical protein